MPFFHSLNTSNKSSPCVKKTQDLPEIPSGVQQWPYYRDLTIESGIKYFKFNF